MNRFELEKILASGDEAQLDHALTSIVSEVKYKFERYSKREYGLKIDMNDIDDVFQETLTTFIKKIQKEGARIIHSTVEAFIMEIGKNKWKEFFRNKTLYSKRLNTWLQTFDEPEEEDHEAHEALIKLISDKLSLMGEACIKLLKLRYWDKKRYSEILQEMPELNNENNCKQRHHSCITQLRKIMKV